MLTISSGKRLFTPLAAAALVAVACGGQTATGSDAGPVGPCPTSAPTTGAACSPNGLTCEYGDDPACLTRADCASGSWIVGQPKCSPTDPSCPATRESAAGKACSTQGARCNYAGLGCTCTNCTKYPVVQCSGPLLWDCDAPNTTPGCPAARPNLGSACSKEGLFCDYGCEPNVSRKCSGGGWTAASSPQGCAISTREAKRDIHYLDGSERTHVADQTRALKLSTWHYKDPALGEREHLGIILEDAPDAPSADVQRRQVDLYGYTSMVLALAQDQDRELRELRARIDELEKRLPPPPKAQPKPRP